MGQYDVASVSVIVRVYRTDDGVGDGMSSVLIRLVVKWF